VLPPLALVYLICAHAPVRTRIVQLLAAFVAMLVAGGWWIAIVQFWPTEDRPYIGGSQSNSILELTLGYNGLGRLNGDQPGSVSVTGAANPGHWGDTGFLRLFHGSIGGQIAWLLPAAVILGGAALWYARGERRTRAALLLWATTFLVTAVTFSFMAGIFHAYYTIALAPAVAALVGIGATTVWRHRAEPAARAALAAVAVLTAALAVFLLRRSPDFLSWLQPLIVVAGLAGAVGLIRVHLVTRRLATAIAGVALASGLAGPTAFAVDTVGTPHTGAIPSAGPARSAQAATRSAGVEAPAPPSTRSGPAVPNGYSTGYVGGLLDASTSTPAINRLLQEQPTYTWAAAAVGSNVASGYQLASGSPVMAIGGFNGSDPFPTLEQFQAWARYDQVHYFVAGGLTTPPGSESAQIQAWVRASFQSRTVTGITLYDLSRPLR